MKRLALILIALIFMVSACVAPGDDPPEPTTPIPTDPPTILEKYKEMAYALPRTVLVMEMDSIYEKKGIIFQYRLLKSDGALFNQKENDEIFEEMLGILTLLIDDEEAHKEYSVAAIQTSAGKSADDLISMFCVDLIERQPIVFGLMEDLIKIMPAEFYTTLAPYGFLKLYLEQGPSAFEVAP